MDRMKFVHIGERAATARQMITALNTGEREWLMSIPARPDVDPDLVISASLGDIPQLVAYIHALKHALQPFTKYVDALLEAELRGEYVGVYVRCDWLRQTHPLLHNSPTNDATQAQHRYTSGATQANQDIAHGNAANER